MTDVQECVIEGWLPDQVANGPHGHWSTRHKKHAVAMLTVWGSLKQAGWVPVAGRARLEIVFVFPSKRRRDADNLYSRAKGCIDALHPDWIVDDSTEWLDLSVTAEVEPGRKATKLRLSEA